MRRGALLGFQARVARRVRVAAAVGVALTAVVWAGCAPQGAVDAQRETLEPPRVNASLDREVCLLGTPPSEGAYAIFVVGDASQMVDVELALEGERIIRSLVNEHPRMASVVVGGAQDLHELLQQEVSRAPAFASELPLAVVDVR